MNKNIILADKTIKKIDDYIKADQGASFRKWLGLVIPHISDAYRPENESFRGHMGASQIGSECARSIWYNFRWATKPDFNGRLLRLFNRGHLEEARFIAMLLMIGCEVYQQDENGNQYRISHAEGHFGGSGDGTVIGLPELDMTTVALAEFKTHGEKSFASLEAEGVRNSKFEHYVQMNVYMRKMGLGVGLYLAVNKNTDALYGEIIPLDSNIADQFLERGEKLVFAEEPPTKINNSPGFFKCRFCDHRPVCHLTKAPDRNCRTCKNSKPIANKEWFCTLHNAILEKEEQLEACNNYEQF